MMINYKWFIFLRLAVLSGKRIYSVTDTIPFCLALFKRETMISYLISVAFLFLP